MDIIKQIGLTGIVPVVVLEDPEQAVSTANALREGGVDVMEITLRTVAGLDSIKKIAQECPDMVLGAGTVMTLEQCKMCVDAGARFIVSPGFNRELVEWCIKNDIACTPGCVTPTEITMAVSYGLNVLKFFPANIYGGLQALKALAGPFGEVKFIPTGGISLENIAEYAASSFVHAVGGSWLCSKADISAGNFGKITEMAKASIKALMGFEFSHVGINIENSKTAEDVADKFDMIFGFDIKSGNSSIMVAGSRIEVIRSKYIGTMGHLAVKTNNIERAVAYLSKKSIEIDWDTAKYKDNKCIAVYLKDEIGCFGVHLLQKQ